MAAGLEGVIILVIILLVVVLIEVVGINSRSVDDDSSGMVSGSYKW